MRFLAPPLLMLTSGLIVLLGTIGFASLRPEYTHFRNTISELGETGAALSLQVSYGMFLPAGILVWIAMYLAASSAETFELKVVLALLSSLGTGYVMAAFFPCDPGSPLMGSWRQQVHNIFGFIEYAGTAGGLLLAGNFLLKKGLTTAAVLFGLGGLVVLLCLTGLSIASAFQYRGAIQRVAEAIMFFGVTALAATLRSEA
jgi:hypothetical protein